VHHLTQRGNHRQIVFFCDAHRELYLSLLREHSLKHYLAVLAYCLMTNHVHVVAVPYRRDSLATAIGRTHQAYARVVQKEMNKTGHLWQNRFFSCPVSADDLWAVMCYVELNPVRAGLTQFPWEWKWSSAIAHITGIDELGLLDWKPWDRFYDGEQWKAFLMSNVMETALPDRVRRATRTGRPLGTEDFSHRLEVISGRKLAIPRRLRKPGS
jgi:putative transposase